MEFSPREMGGGPSEVGMCSLEDPNSLGCSISMGRVSRMEDPLPFGAILGSDVLNGFLLQTCQVLVQFFQGRFGTYEVCSPVGPQLPRMAHQSRKPGVGLELKLSED